ncbi:MAG: hypothetical protein ACI3YD_01440 [Alloprevotella sp.]
MKKFFSFTLISLFFAATTAFAQSEQKEYNMVITLQNGTTVTLGHNDIRDITFNNGEISISGNVVETIAKIASTADSLANVSSDSQYRLEQALVSMDYVIKMNEEAQKNIAELQMGMDEMHARIMATSDELLHKIATLEEAMDASNTYMTMMQDMIEKNRVISDEMMYRLEEHEAIIGMLMERIDALESQLAQ